MNKLCCILFLLCSFAGFSQRTIKGRVVNVGGAPVPGSSVFITNTSTGTTSDRDGNFELNEVPVGKHDLIISSIGYETSVYSFSSEQLPLRLKVVMEVKVRELENVMVEPSVEESWNKWGKLFTDNFVGSTPNALLCKIKNEKAIHFRYYKKTNRLIAYSDEPLILENKALGYQLKYQLENFEVNFSEHSSAFAGYPFFEEIDKKRKGLQNKWKAKRDKSYYGSMMHFMRAVFTDSLIEQGFEVRRMRKEPNTEKERVKKIYGRMRTMKGVSNMTVIVGPKSSSPAIPDTSTGTKSLPVISADSSSYYDRILGQEDFKEIYGKDILPADSLIAQNDGHYKLFLFPNYLYITYKKEFEDQAYILFSRENRGVSFQRSIIWLTINDGVILDQNGSYFPPQAIYASAYWGWSEKVADMLPIDYMPGSRK